MRAPQGDNNLKGFAMNEIDINDIGGMKFNDYARYPYKAYYCSFDITGRTKYLLFVMQRLVDEGLPLTVTELAKYSNRSPFEIKIELDEIERAGLRIREYDEASGEYRLIRY